eukprot:TRINITY_DN10615_c1_g1_i1.p1 TRINITY_DN10615_c1_g1~~TRINITY_DN10615_c1_g1_i1.p1  ORF type:complete len:211 (-),score=38.68 TRINITY_DN10615_c1_g1_i1:298-930(-)
MDMLAIQAMNTYGGKLEVRNTFLELRMPSAKMVRSMSESSFMSGTPRFSNVLATSDSASNAKPDDRASKPTPARSKVIEAEEGTEDEGCINGMKTVIVRDVPCRVDYKRMMAELKLLGFDGCYDFINFPINPRNGKDSCRGYGFVNFLSERLAARFMSRFANYRFDDIDSHKVARVELARTQGYLGYEHRTRTSRAKRAWRADPQGLKAL